MGDRIYADLQIGESTGDQPYHKLTAEFMKMALSDGVPKNEALTALLLTTAAVIKSCDERDRAPLIKHFTAKLPESVRDIGIITEDDVGNA